MESVIEKEKFLNMLEEIIEIAGVQGRSLTQEEIQEYFKGIELTREHLDAIYAYLSENKITVKGFFRAPEKEELPEEQKEADSIYLSMYLKDLEGIVPEKQGETKQLYPELRSGREGAKERLTEIWLSRVVELARGYQNQGVFLEDLIQEGNMGLLSGIEMLLRQPEYLDAEEYLKESVCRSMEDLIDEAMEEDDLENTVLAKTNLISEAAKLLAEDLGRTATLEELAEYAKLPAEEIEDILNLSLDALKAGEGEHHHG